MIYIPKELPARVTWESENGKWAIIAKVSVNPYHNDLVESDLHVLKLDNQTGKWRSEFSTGKWRPEYSRKHYPAYVLDKLREFELAIEQRKREWRV